MKFAERAREIIKHNLSRIIIVLICITYIAQGMFVIVKADFDLETFIGRIGTSLICGLAIYTSMRESGIQDAKASDTYISSLQLYALTKSKIVKKYLLNAFCVYKNKQAIEEKKQEILEQNGLDYTMYKKGKYDKNSVLYSTLENEEKKALEIVEKQAFVVRSINTKYLLSDSPKLDKKKLKKGEIAIEVSEYKRKSFFTDLFNMILWAAIFSLYGLEPITSGSWEKILWNTWQIICWISCGISKYLSSRNFIENEYRQSHLVYKIELLEEFIQILQDNPALIEPYDYVGKEIKKEEEEQNAKQQLQ